ncbi:MAG: hypothetical protein JSS04_08325 [Proteobacteria bacterium]|nr:hypothetical protein [Pseudomonadota bacterium]
MPLFRSRTQLPTFRLGPFLIFLVICVVALGVAALAIFEPRPPVKHFEVPVPSERFSR